MNRPIIERVTKLYLDTNYANLFALPGLFRLQSLFGEFETAKFERWVDSLRIPPVSNLWINAVNIANDKEEIYTKNDYILYKYGELIARSSALPGFIKKGNFLDGGISQNPCLTPWKDEEKTIIVSQLMMPYRTIPRSRISKLMYAWEFKAFESFEADKKNYKDLKVIYPMIDDIDSADFSLSKKSKEKIITDAYRETSVQLDALGLLFQPQGLEVCMGLSGGGIRSGAHIGVLSAFLERNIFPVKWSGTSGGAAFAALFAGFWSEMDHELDQQPGPSI